MANAEKLDIKKPYEPPSLTVYGNVSQLTKKVGTSGKLDGGRLAGHNKTHFL
jgi:hypothetical protein